MNQLVGRSVKRLLCCTCAVSVALAALTGCGGKEAQAEHVSQEGRTGSAGSAPDFPGKKTITLVVPASAGGGTDLLARLFAQEASESWGTNVVVSNVTGAAGALGMNQVRRAEPDGYTVLFFHNAILLSKLAGVSEYSVEAFEPGPNFILDDPVEFYVSGDNGEITSARDLQDRMQAEPGELNCCVEVGGYTYYAMRACEQALGGTFNVVDVGSNSDKVTALLGGHVDVMPNSWATARDYVADGKFRCLGIPTGERSELLPDVPTFKEQGIDFTYPGYYFGFWFPKGTPQEVIDIYDELTRRICEDEEMIEQIRTLGYYPYYQDSGDKEKHYDDMKAYYEELEAKVQEGRKK